MHHLTYQVRFGCKQGAYSSKKENNEMSHLVTWKRAKTGATTSAKLGALLVGLLWSSAAFAAVTTETGQVEGTAQDGMTVYLGIPFAAPPVGDLRWRAPTCCEVDRDQDHQRCRDRR